MRSLVKQARILLSGLTEPNEWSIDLSLRNYLPIQNMLQRCVEFLPILKQTRFDPQEQVCVYCATQICD